MGAAGSLWESLGTNGSCWELLGAAGSLWEPVGATDQWSRPGQCFESVAVWFGFSTTFLCCHDDDDDDEAPHDHSHLGFTSSPSYQELCKDLNCVRSLFQSSRWWRGVGGGGRNFSHQPLLTSELNEYWSEAAAMVTPNHQLGSEVRTHRCRPVSLYERRLDDVTSCKLAPRAVTVLLSSLSYSLSSQW